MARISRIGTTREKAGDNTWGNFGFWKWKRQEERIASKEIEDYMSLGSESQTDGCKPSQAGALPVGDSSGNE